MSYVKALEYCVDNNKHLLFLIKCKKKSKISFRIVRFVNAPVNQFYPQFTTVC